MVDDCVVVVLFMFYVFCLIVVVNVLIVNGVMILMLLKFSLKEVFCICCMYELMIFVGVLTMYNYLYLFEEVSVEDVKMFCFCIFGGVLMFVVFL